MTTEAALITTTVASTDDAARLATMLVEKRLAACVQEIDIGSRYRWEGSVQAEAEILMLVKTAPDRVDAAIAALEADHPYDVPEILVVEDVRGSTGYLDWVWAETRLPQS